MVLTEREKEAQLIIVKEINTALDILDNHFIKFGYENGLNSAPINYISQSIKIFKEGYNKAVEGIEVTERLDSDVILGNVEP